MPQITNFEHNGITVITNEPPPPLGPPGENVVAWVVTAPDKHESVPLNRPYRVSNSTTAALLDSKGDERGTGWHAAIQTLQRTRVPQYFIVVEEGADEAETTKNIIGGVDTDTRQLTGISALALCPERPTLIAAPGFSHQKSVVDALASMANKLRCRVIADGPAQNIKQAMEYSKQFGGEGTGHDRVYIVEPMPAIYSKKAKGNIYVPTSTLAMGAVAAVKPWESPGNQGIYIQDVSYHIDYNIIDKSTDGNLLNKHGISYFARTSDGWRLIGNRTVTGDFISHIGLKDAIARKLEAASQRAMSKNLTMSFMEQEITKVDLFMQDLVAAEIIPGGKVYLHPELNTVSRYKNGSWYIVVEYGRYSPNEHMIYHVNASDNIIEEFLEEVLS
ncbi:phage tail sheath protein [Spartinivicinus ruber]|uniref:phage tail protein n=1 Tax=Spartinivicinus ruber TaxID=2683272 RepID=UPI0013D10FBA|nr:phage tail protein [Spartinivicinus ruber]